MNKLYLELCTHQTMSLWLVNAFQGILSLEMIPLQFQSSTHARAREQNSASS